MNALEDTTETLPAFPKWVPLVLLIAGLCAYHNSFSGPFIFDDVSGIVDNPTIRQLWPIRRVLSPPSDKGQAVGGRPLLNLSFALNYAMGGLNVRGYHVTNLAIHILAALTLYGIVRRTLLLPALRERWGRTSGSLALVIALIWMLHPLQSEPVNYIVARAELLMGLFYWLTLYCVIRGAGSCKAVFWYAAAVLLCLLGMATKEVMITAPLVVLLYDRTFLAGSFVEAWRKRCWLYLGLAATWGLLAYLVISAGILAHNPEFLAERSTVTGPWSYVRSQPRVILHYLRLSVWPSSQCAFYQWPVAVNWGEILPSAVLVGLLVAITVWGLRHRKPWGVAGGWFFLILAPTSSVMPLVDLICERRMYLSLAAVVSLVVLAGHELLGRVGWRPGIRRKLEVGVAVIVAVALACLTVRRNTVYSSEVAMFSDILKKRAVSPELYNYLGIAYYKLGQTNQSLEYFLKAVQIQPDYMPSLYNLAWLYHLQGRDDESIALFRRVLQINPHHAASHYYLGQVLAAEGKLDEAIAEFEETLRLIPSHAETRKNLGDALAELGRTQEAIAQYREALRQLPDSPDILNSLAWILATHENPQFRDGAEAVRLSLRANEVTGGNDAAILDTLAAAYADAGRYDDAVQTAQNAVSAALAQDEKLVADIQARLKLYETGRPYHQSRETKEK